MTTDRLSATFPAGVFQQHLCYGNHTLWWDVNMYLEEIAMDRELPG